MTIYRSKSELKSCSYIKCPKFKFLYSPLSLSNYKINFKKIYYKNTMSEHLGSSFNGREKCIVNLEFWSSIHYGSVCRIFSKCPMDKKGNSMEKKTFFLYIKRKNIYENKIKIRMKYKWNISFIVNMYHFFFFFFFCVRRKLNMLGSKYLGLNV